MSTDISVKMENSPRGFFSLFSDTLSEGQQTLSKLQSLMWEANIISAQYSRATQFSDAGQIWVDILMFESKSPVSSAISLKKFIDKH